MFLNKLKTLFTVSVCLISVSLFGQDLEKDMTEIAEVMKTASSVSIGVDIKMYSKKGGGIIYKGNASLTKSQESTKSVLAEMEFISTPTHELRVDHEEKEVLIFKKEKPSDTGSSNTEEVEFDVEALKKLIESEESSTKKPTIKLVSFEGGIKKYSITGNPNFSELILEIDMTNKKIVSVTMEYGNGSSKGQYVVLKYSKFSYNEDVSSVFNLTNYFTEEENNYVLSPTLKEYQLYTEL